MEGLSCKETGGSLPSCSFPSALNTSLSQKLQPPLPKISNRKHTVAYPSQNLGLYRDLATVTQVHIAPERTWELPIPLLPSSPQMETATRVCSDRPEQAIHALPKHDPISISICALKKTAEMVWLALYQIIHSFRDQKIYYSIKEYRHWRQEMFKKTTNQQKKHNQKPHKTALTCAISRKPSCSLRQLMLFTTPAGQGNMHLSASHLNRNSSHRQPHQLAPLDELIRPCF